MAEKAVAAAPGSSAPTGRAPLGASEVGMIVLLGLIWGSAFVVIRLGLISGASPLAFGFGRFAGAAIVMGALALLARERAPDRRTLLLSALVGGAFFIGGYAALLYLGEAVLSGGFSSVLVGTLPLWSSLFGFGILPTERLGRSGTLGLGVGFVGLTVLFLPDLLAGASGSLRAELLVIGAAVVGAGSSVLLRRWLSGPTGQWGLTTEFAAAAVMLGLLAVAVPGQAALPFTPVVLLSLAYLVVLPSIVGYTIYFRLLHRVGPARANLVAYVNPLGGLGIGALLLAESVSGFEVAGFLLIVSGLFLVQRDRS
ncbi:MAG: EamA family transporter [Thermoplasmata archaeon]|nr:EamA family transporter [Thermoplasmata archaeon]